MEDDEGKPTESEKEELIPSHRNTSSKSGWTFWLVYTAAVVVLGSSFQFGYGTSVMNAPEEVRSGVMLLSASINIFCKALKNNRQVM